MLKKKTAVAMAFLATSLVLVASTGCEVIAELQGRRQGIPLAGRYPSRERILRSLTQEERLCANLASIATGYIPGEANEKNLLDKQAFQRAYTDCIDKLNH